MTFPTRDQVRTEYAKELIAVCSLAQKFYAYEPYDFGQESPVVTINSIGTGLAKLTYDGHRAEYDFDVSIWILYSDLNSSYYEEDSEALLDQLSGQVLSTLGKKQNGLYWHSRTLRDRASAGYTARGGKLFRTEIIPLRIGVSK